VRADGTARANAVEQLALGHHRDALAAYLRLAHLQPERPAYAALVRILERKLRVRCAQQAEADGTACAGAAP
jgi:hypothetical protein